MSDFYDNLDHEIQRITDQYNIKNLITIRNFYNPNDYWPRLASLSFFNKLFEGYRYHFLYEIQGLSSQIHFGLASCFLLRDKISQRRGRPNVYNHRYTFMIESTIHAIYAYWNRVGLVLNTYLKAPKDIKRTYFSNVVQQLEADYVQLNDRQHFQWIIHVKTTLDALNRNEFAHNNSLIMQDFLSGHDVNDEDVDLLAFPELLLSHNRYIVDDIDNLINLIVQLEQILADQT